MLAEILFDMHTGNLEAEIQAALKENSWQILGQSNTRYNKKLSPKIKITKIKRLFRDRDLQHLMIIILKSQRREHLIYYFFHNVY